MVFAKAASSWRWKRRKVERYNDKTRKRRRFERKTGESGEVDEGTEDYITD
jgi:hypothetical protein